MNKDSKIRSAIIALVIIMVLASSAYLISGVLHDRLVPKVDEVGIEVTVVMQQESGSGMGWTDEQSNITTIVKDGWEYIVGIKLSGLDIEKGVVLKLTITAPDISVDDVESALWFDNTTHVWQSLEFVDVGNTLEAVVGPSDGQDVFDGFDRSYLMIISFSVDGTITLSGHGEPV